MVRPEPIPARGLDAVPDLRVEVPPREGPLPRVADPGCGERFPRLSGVPKALAVPYGAVEGSESAGPMRRA
jgi:hypothetical protein